MPAVEPPPIGECPGTIPGAGAPAGWPIGGWFAGIGVPGAMGGAVGLVAG